MSASNPPASAATKEKAKKMGLRLTVGSGPRKGRPRSEKDLQAALKRSRSMKGKKPAFAKNSTANKSKKPKSKPRKKNPAASSTANTLSAAGRAKLSRAAKARPRYPRGHKLAGKFMPTGRRANATSNIYRKGGPKGAQGGSHSQLGKATLRGLAQARPRDAGGRFLSTGGKGSALRRFAANPGVVPSTGGALTGTATAIGSQALYGRVWGLRRWFNRRRPQTIKVGDNDVALVMDFQIVKEGEAFKATGGAARPMTAEEQSAFAQGRGKAEDAMSTEFDEAKKVAGEGGVGEYRALVLSGAPAMSHYAVQLGAGAIWFGVGELIGRWRKSPFILSFGRSAALTHLLVAGYEAVTNGFPRLTNPELPASTTRTPDAVEQIPLAQRKQLTETQKKTSGLRSGQTPSFRQMSDRLAKATGADRLTEAQRTEARRRIEARMSGRRTGQAATRRPTAPRLGNGVSKVQIRRLGQGGRREQEVRSVDPAPNERLTPSQRAQLNFMHGRQRPAAGTAFWAGRPRTGAPMSVGERLRDPAYYVRG